MRRKQSLGNRRWRCPSVVPAPLPPCSLTSATSLCRVKQPPLPPLLLPVPPLTTAACLLQWLPPRQLI
ncbi:hypothetical protein DPMN_017283 [Dreissena polymorpha]|uniref:Uncharacterized protein n=1 Tax=Dreissena polymorpha TaxID=45954 RepID=A0A9D4NG63_DREPO|nr:hypothetical protein DPMN_017283 [Dreissena polymorpha]